MTSYHSRQTLYRVIIICSAILSGCSTSQYNSSRVNVTAVPQLPSQVNILTGDTLADALRLLQESYKANSHNKSVEAQLKAATIYLNYGLNQEAATILYPISPNALPSLLKGQYVIASARIALEKQDSEEALAIINSRYIGLRRVISKLPLTQQVQISQLKSQALSMEGLHLASARHRTFLAPLLEDQEYEKNHSAIWTDLLNVPVEDIAQRANLEPSDDFRAWLQLAHLYKSQQNNINEQLTELKHWQISWSHHPAAQLPPESIETLASLSTEKLERIAVLLPLSGKLATVSTAIRNGIMTAYYSDLEKTNTPPSIQFYDTNTTQSFSDTYKTAVDDGADLIIGPLTKQNVEHIQRKLILPVPTLALNSLNNKKGPKGLYQFGLSAEDEAEQIAQRAWNEGHRLAAMIYPKTPWGERTSAAFEASWLKLGGQIVVKKAFDGEYNQIIKQALNIHRSEQRASDLRHALQRKLEFSPRRRDDIDFIFMLATPMQAYQLKPALNFHYAKSLPVYTTSHVYQGYPNQNKDKDLNGIFFSDAPWVLEDKDPLFANSEKAWPNGQGHYQRLYAMGLDAYRLFPRLKLLDISDNAKVFGSTGTLSMTDDRHIYRELLWAKFKRGVPVIQDYSLSAQQDVKAK